MGDELVALPKHDEWRTGLSAHLLLAPNDITPARLTAVLRNARQPLKVIRRFLEDEEHASPGNLQALRKLMVMFHRVVDDGNEKLLDSLPTEQPDDATARLVDDLGDIAEDIWNFIDRLDAYRTLVEAARPPPPTDIGHLRRTATPSLPPLSRNTEALITARREVLRGLKQLESTIAEIVRVT